MTSTKSALVVVDVQRDFCPGGALGVKDGDKIIKPINKVVRAFLDAGLPVFFTRDWHPKNHISFKSRGGVWPPHCIQGTTGAEFHPNLDVPKDARIVSKGTDPDREAYSAFQGTDLEQRLKILGVSQVFLAGLTTDYCVRESSLDALEAGIKVDVLEDCIKGVDLKKGDSARAIQEITERGAKLVSSAEAVRSSKAEA